jgi:O-antigen ligase
VTTQTVQTFDGHLRLAARISSVRSILFIATLLLSWITVRPFMSLADASLSNIGDGGNLLNQLAYSVVTAIVAVYLLLHEPRRVLPVLRIPYAAMLAWLAITVATSTAPGMSARRLLFSMMVMLLAAALPLLATSLRHFCDLLAGTTVLIIALCYGGVALVPELAIHQASDIVEPLLAGDWRGAFVHKNDAGPMMAIFVFVGLFIANKRSALLGCAIAAAAAVFLYLSHAKSATAVLPLVLALSFVTQRVRAGGICAVLIFGLLGAFTLITLGSLKFETVRTLNETVLSDPTFTGRVDIWRFAIDNIRDRPWLGHGFVAFWENPVTYFEAATEGNPVTFASHAHNALLNLALTIGVPGAALAAFWTVVLPFRDMQACKAAGADAALTTFFTRIWLLCLCLCNFESLLFDRADPAWFTMLAAMFGLRYLSTLRLDR